MPDRHPPSSRAHDSVLVFGIAAVVLGVVMVSRGGLPAPSSAHRVSPTHAAQGRVERLVPAQDARPVAIAPPAERVPTAAAPRTASCGTTTHTWACAPRHDLDHDLRLVLAAMALQQRRTLHPTAHFVRPDKQDIPAIVELSPIGDPIATPRPSQSVLESEATRICVGDDHERPLSARLFLKPDPGTAQRVEKGEVETARANSCEPLRKIINSGATGEMEEICEHNHDDK
jgi:hypothetical protein